MRFGTTVHGISRLLLRYSTHTLVSPTSSVPGWWFVLSWYCGRHLLAGFRTGAFARSLLSWHPRTRRLPSSAFFPTLYYHPSLADVVPLYAHYAVPCCWVSFWTFPPPYWAFVPDGGSAFPSCRTRFLFTLAFGLVYLSTDADAATSLCYDSLPHSGLTASALLCCIHV